MVLETCQGTQEWEQQRPYIYWPSWTNHSNACHGPWLVSGTGKSSIYTLRTVQKLMTTLLGGWCGNNYYPTQYWIIQHCEQSTNPPSCMQGHCPVSHSACSRYHCFDFSCLVTGAHSNGCRSYTITNCSFCAHSIHAYAHHPSHSHSASKGCTDWACPIHSHSASKGWGRCLIATNSFSNSPHMLSPIRQGQSWCEACDIVPHQTWRERNWPWHSSWLQ